MKRSLPIFIIVCVLLAAALAACSPPDTAKTVVGIEVAAFPNTVYYERTELNLEGARITLRYSDNSVESLDITASMVAGYNPTNPARQELTITYLTFTKTVVVEVKERILSSVKLLNRATQAEAAEFQLLKGEQLSLTDHLLRLYYEGGFTADIAVDIPSMVPDFNTSLPAGEHTLKIWYGDHIYDTFKVRVTESELNPAETYVFRDQRPTKTDYYVGGTFEPAGLKMTLTYTDKTTTVVSYTEENKDDFVFEYDFRVDRPNSPVTVTYREVFTATFEVRVNKVLSTGMSFDYENAAGEQINGRPLTRGIQRNGVTHAPTGMQNILQGDTIDWTSGSAMVSYADGTTEIVRLDAPSVNKEGAWDTDTPGVYTIRLYFGTVSWRTELNITVEARKPYALLLENTESVCDKIHLSGQTIVPDLVAYNVLFNNGEYLVCRTYLENGVLQSDKRTAADVADWASLTINMLRSGSLTASNTTDEDYITQTLEYYYETVSAKLEIMVARRTATGISLAPPAVDCVQRQDTVQAFFLLQTGGSVTVFYNDATRETLPLTDESLSFAVYDPNGNLAGESFNTEGEYTVRATHTPTNLFADYTVNCVLVSVATISLEGLPASNVFPHFDAIPFDEMYLRVTYTNATTADLYLSDAADRYIYTANRQYIGLQTVQFRYMGKLVSYVVQITGKKAVAVEVKTAPRLAYALNAELDFAGMALRIFYNDGSSHTETGTAAEWSARFAAADVWTCKLLESVSNKTASLATVGQKRVVLTYTQGETRLTTEYGITVQGTVSKIEIDNTGAAFNGGYLEVDGNPLTGEKGELNVYGVYLKVYYEEDEAGIFHLVALTRGAVNYDPQAVYKNAQNEVLSTFHVDVYFGGKSASLSVRIIDRRILTGIEIFAAPRVTLYPEHMDLSLEGGVLKRSYSNGTIDYYSMLNADVEAVGYLPDIFSGLSPSQGSYNQNITLYHGGCEVRFDVTTVRKQSLSGNISYANITYVYGDPRIPAVAAIQTYSHFEAPALTLEFQNKDGSWVRVSETAYPKLPGTYPLRVIVTENEYYAGAEVEERSCYVMEKTVTVRVRDYTKYYNSSDPVYNADSYVIDDVLVTDEFGNVDVLKLRVWRVPANKNNTTPEEDVLYGGDGAPIGYELMCELVDPADDNNNDRYALIVYAGSLRILPMELREGVSFYGTENLYYNGTARFITAAYYYNGLTISIQQKDLIYREGGPDGEILSGAPANPGTYYVEVGKNYKVTTGNNFVIYTISN